MRSGNRDCILRLRAVWLLSSLLVAKPLLAMEAVDLLRSMSASMRDSTYSGTFVYRHKDKVETLQIIHRKTSSGVNERLMTLSGKPREIIRDDSVVTCIWPDSKLVLVDKAAENGDAKSRFPGIVPRDLDRLPEHYALAVQEQNERVAGRDTYLVSIDPKDQYRYGYRLWIDKDSRLLMRSDLLNEQRHAVEQVMFTDLGVHDSLPDSAFTPQLLEEGYQWREMQDGPTPASSAQPAQPMGNWSAENLPPGFTLQFYNRRIKGRTPEPVEHMVFSDGIASVSVFIESYHQDKPVERKERRGALNVYGKRVDGHRIVVLGEVPGSTVQLIGDAIQQRQRQPQ